MSEKEYLKTKDTQKLQGSIPGTDSSKWLSTDYDKVVRFENDAVPQGTKQYIVEFQLTEEYMDYLDRTSIPQANSKGLPNVKYHYEGLPIGSSDKNYGITQSELDFFNENIIRIITK